MRTNRPSATYLQPRAERRSHGVAKWRWLVSTVAFFISLFILAAGLNFSPTQAHADDKNDYGTIGSAIGDRSPQDISKEIFNPSTTTPNVNTFPYLIKRVFTPSYINYLPQAQVAGNTAATAARIGFTGSNYACNTNQVGAGTVVYHNCDVPNFAAEFIQSVYSLIDSSGVHGATPTNSVSALFPGFGESKKLPGNTVPAVVEGAPNKYTGLEAFGYDLNLTSYYGEWDRINTMNTARLLTNFSVFDSIGLTAKSLGDAIGGAFNRGNQLAAQGWNSGGIIGAIGGFFTGAMEGASGGAINTILDTSDANVVLNYGWYRTNYAQTAYGIRELQDQEIDAQIRASFLSYLNSSMPADQTFDKWLKNTSPDGAIMSKGPKENISKCEVSEYKNGKIVLSEISSVDGNNNTKAPGVTEFQCSTEQSKPYVVWSSSQTYDTGVIVRSNGTYYEKKNSVSTSVAPKFDSANWSELALKKKWSVDGTQKAESFNAWYDRIKGEAGDWSGNISKYEIPLSESSCTPAKADSTSGTDAKDAYSSWLLSCWTPEWNTATALNETNNQDTQNTGWLDSLLTPSVLAQWANMPANKDAFDFNSPWVRYVCLHPDGTDVITGYWGDTISGGNQGTPKLARAYDQNGNITPACKAATDQTSFRSPIQGALFGDGYTHKGASQSPGVDTRQISNFQGPAISLTYPLWYRPLSLATQGLFLGGQFLTQMSNELITWTYEPILQAWGINDLVINLIQGFRDGIFFPMVLLVVALAGLYVLYQAGVRRKYREGFVSILYLAITFILGTVLMIKTADVVNFVDRAPANVEKAVMSIVLSSAVNGDKLCATDSSIAASADLNGLKNVDINASTSSSGFANLFSDKYSSADDPLRSMLCLNWKAFVYEPWAFAQWGTSSSNLDASKMTNTNSGLVGNAAVDLGGSNGVVNNWAVYQLYTTKMGSSLNWNFDTTLSTVKSKDFYKIVDLQAGPNNGAGTDNRYLAAWSGSDPMNRLGVGVMSSVAAGAGFAVVGMYAFSKIMVTFLSVLLLIFLPFVFLLGLFPTKRREVTKYLLTILGLMIQRVALVIVLCIFFLFLIGFLGAANSYQSIFLMILIVCIIFWKFRKKILDFAMFSNSTSAGGVFAKARGAASATGKMMPQTVQNAAAMTKNSIVYGLPGAAFGVINGKGAYESFRQTSDARNQVLRRKQRGAGFGVLERIYTAGDAKERDILRQAREKPNLINARENIKMGSPEMQNYVNELESYQADVEKYWNLVENAGMSEEDIPVLNADGTPVLNGAGNEVTRRGLIASGRDSVTDEQFSDVMMYKPVKPERPQFEDEEFSLGDIKILSEYDDLSNKREALLYKRDNVRKTLYNDSRGKTILDSLPKRGATEKQVIEAVAENLPNSKGFTDLQRAQMSKAISALTAIDKDIETTLAELEKVGATFRDRQRSVAIEKDSTGFMKGVIDDVQTRTQEIIDEKRGE